jgi:hypothetical protein
MHLGSAPIELGVRATSGLPVSIRAEGPCVVTDGRVRATGVGTCVLTATQSGDEAWAAAPVVVGELTIERAPQTISFDAPASLVLGDPAVEIAAAASSGQPVTLMTEGPCAVTEGTTLVPTGAGTCRVTASQAGDADWAAAEPVVRVVAIARTPQSISFEAPPDTVFRNGPLDLEASATSELPVSIVAQGPCTIADGRVVATGAGTCTLTARQAGDDQWAPANDVVHELRVARASQVVGLPALASRRLGDPPVALSAAATSGLPVKIDVEGPCELDAAGEVVLTGAGVCRVAASQPGNEDWAPAPPLIRELTIERRLQSVAFEVPAEATFGDPAIVLEATATSGLPVVLTADGPCHVAEGRLVLSGAGSCTLTARQDGDDDWAAALPIVRQISVRRAPQSIRFEAPAAMLVADAPRELDATSTSGLAVAFSPEGSCEIVDGTVRPTGPGLCAITATHPGDASFEAADEVRHVFRVERVPQQIDFLSLPDATFGDPPIELSAEASSGLPVTFAARGACSIEGPTTLVLDGEGRCRVVAVQPGDETWAPADDVSRTFEVSAPPVPAGAGSGGMTDAAEATPEPAGSDATAMSEA